MKPFGIAILSVLLAACSVRPVPRASGPVPLAWGPASSFTPLVAASRSDPRCVEPTNAPVDAGLRAVALLYPDPPVRQVTVTLDSAGDPVRYLDVRGDLSESDDEAADRTTIGLYLEGGYAVLSNRRAGEPPEILEAALEEALTSSSLGNPRQELRLVLATCGGGRQAR